MDCFRLEEIQRGGFEELAYSCSEIQPLFRGLFLV